MNEIGSLRRIAGLSQRELAARSGVAQPNIAAYETGRRTPSPGMVERLRATARPKPSTVLAERRDDITSIARRHKALQVSVFGSTARGDDRPGTTPSLGRARL